MLTRTLLAATCLAGLNAGAHAELFKWTGPDGRTVYSDRPPPAQVAADRPRITAPAGGPAFPYELSQAVANHPVVLYTTTDCPPCESARKLLADRGVPFNEKTVTTADDINHLKKIGGNDGQLPVVAVGRAIQSGFEAGAWTTALDSAGYPKANRLPKGYANPPAKPLAPSVAQGEKNSVSAGNATTGTAARSAPISVELPAQPPGGFRF